jgi:hypothetical protein
VCGNFLALVAGKREERKEKKRRKKRRKKGKREEKGDNRIIDKIARVRIY